jgi:Tfp pilus assembly protein PilF
MHSDPISQNAGAAFTIVFGLVLVFISGSPASGQSAELGRIDFPNSGPPAAQADFLDGVLYLHNFEYSDAAASFRRAQQVASDFALAYWGEAMTYNHPIWMEQDSAAALAVLGRLAPTFEERQTMAPTAREREYLSAVEILYGSAQATAGMSKRERDRAYRDAMRRLYEAYPDDSEAAAFYALSILGTAHEGRDFATYMQAAAVANKVWDADRRHPGAAHYLIHSFDDPIHAPLGLPMARAYSEIAPDAAHAQHMTSHIFVALGLWDDVVRANETARDVQTESLARRGEPARECGHYTFWLEYGYLQQGRLQAAADVMDDCQASLSRRRVGYAGYYYAEMRARYVIDSGDPSAVSRWTADYQPDATGYVTYHMTEALAAVASGDTARAAEELDRIEASGDDDAAIYALQIRGLIAVRRGAVEEGIELLTSAATAEEARPLEFGPPAIAKPSRELLGEVYLEQQRFAEAEEAFRMQLTRTPERTASLLGLARAAMKTGGEEVARESAARLVAIWHRADESVRREADDVTGGP